MLPQSGVKVVFGTGSIGDASDPIVGFSTPDKTQEVFDIFRAHGGNEIDSARGYSPNAPHSSEPLVGQTNVKKWARISTKVDSTPGDHSKANIEKSIDASLEALQVPSLYLEYLHHPDPNTTLEEALVAMDAGHRAGKFEQFGISNYTLDQVREMLAICEEKNLTKPTVYQGQYNAVARKAEDEFLPFLRQHGIKFYAWSPAAAGFFSKTSTRSAGTDKLSQVLQKGYDKPEVKEALAKIHERAEQAGISGHGIALRWALHHSALKGEYGDAIIVGARTVAQMNSTMEICGAGPLPDDLVQLVEDTWEMIKDNAPGFPYP